jgi:thioesterase domain-containing protein
MDNRTPSNVEALQQIWQRAFQRSAIDVNDDFFDLGGDAWLAAELFTEINNQLSVNAAPATICQAPTVAALATALRNPHSCGPALLLRQGAAQAPPIFMLHGIGSSVVDLVPLVRRMQWDQPIYGLEALGNDGKLAPLDRLEDMAQWFATSIREIQPRGPYFLIGYSLGGLVALEIAQQLKAKDQEIALLVMLDSYPDRRYLSFPQYARLLLQLAEKRVSGQTNPTAARKGRLIQTADSPPNSLVRALQRTKDAHYRALRNYRPRFYDGEVTFVRAALPSCFPADPVPVWSPLIHKLNVETVPGEHVSMLTTSIDRLASLLSTFARAAFAVSSPDCKIVGRLE